MIRIFWLSALVALSFACSGKGSTPQKSAPQKSAPQKSAPPQKRADRKAPASKPAAKASEPATKAGGPAAKKCAQADAVKRAICELGPSSSFSVRAAAISTLGRKGPAAKAAIPALRKIIERQGLEAMAAAKALQKISKAFPEAELVKACLARCSERSSRCSRSTSKCRAGGGRRCYGLRRCGCAYVRCKLSCRQYGVADFACR